MQFLFDSKCLLGVGLAPSICQWTDEVPVAIVCAFWAKVDDGCGGFEVPLERERRVVGILLRIIHSIIVCTRFPFACLDVAADTHELFVHVVPVVGDVDV